MSSYVGNFGDSAEAQLKRLLEGVSLPIYFERIEVALASPSIAAPSGLSKEEKRRFILAHAKVGK